MVQGLEADQSYRNYNLQEMEKKMKVKCPRCGYEGEIVNNKCPRCNFHLNSNASKQLNRKIYITVFIIIIVVIAFFTYRHWNNNSAREVAEVAIGKQVDADKTKNSSNNIAVYNLKELDESNIKPKETQTCISLFHEKSNMVNENIALAERRRELDMQYVNIMRDCTRNNSLQSVCQERTQNVRDRIKEVDIENSLLSEKEIENEKERRINNCKQFQ
jgi:hypothetical protein